MKKSNFIITASVMSIMLISCDKETTVKSNAGDPISFRGEMCLVTKGTTIKADLDDFCVTAIKTGTTETYFADAMFKKDNTTSTYLSEQPYYWPESGSLDFYAHAPAENGQVVENAYNNFTVTPAEASSETAQVDLLYAVTPSQSKAENAAGVRMKFIHTMSRVIVQLKNSQPNLKFEISELKLAYLHKEGNVDLSGVTTTLSEDFLTPDAWTTEGTITSENCYTQPCEMSIGDGAAAVQAGKAMVLVPQSVMKADKYGNDQTANGSYIAVKGKILNATDGTRIFPEDDNDRYMMFPAKFILKPGKQYTYTVDLCGGGYQETGGSEGEGGNLEPVIENSIIKFVDVSVDNWVESNNN